MSRSASKAPPFRLHDPRSVAPVVLTCEHAANRLPWARKPATAERRVLNAHWGWDIGAWQVTLDMARRLRTSAIGGRWSRLVVDLNRRVDDPTLIRRSAGRFVLPWNDGVAPEEVERRVHAYHSPYHVEIDHLILSRLVRGVRPLLLAVHSFTPRFAGKRRPFQVGVLYEHHRGLAHRLGRVLREEGLTVRYNQPYSGMKGMMYAADRHGSHHRLPCLEVEINQRMFERAGAVRKLGRILSRGARALLDRSA